MKKQNFAKNILEKIKHDHIEPKSKWQFRTKNIAMWIFGIISLFIGGLAVAVSIFMIRHEDWDLYMQFNPNILKFAMATLPYAWIILFSIFILLAHVNFKNTKSGYKYRLQTLIAIGFIISFVLGIIFYNVGIGEYIDNTMSRHELYTSHINKRHDRWAKPEEGRLSGIIIDIKQQHKGFTLIDRNKKHWDILIESLSNEDDFLEELLQPQHKVRIIGQQIDDSRFTAYEILPWLPQKMHEMNLGERKNFKPRIKL